MSCIELNKKKNWNIISKDTYFLLPIKKMKRTLESVFSQKKIQLQYSEFIVTKNDNKRSLFFATNIKWYMNAILQC